MCIGCIMNNGLLQFNSGVLCEMATSPQGTWGEFCWWREMQHLQHEQVLVLGAHLSWLPHRSWWLAPLLHVHTSGQVRLLPQWQDQQSAESTGVASVEACHTSTCPPKTLACSQMPVGNNMPREFNFKQLHLELGLCPVCTCTLTLTLSLVSIWALFLCWILITPGGWIQASPSTWIGIPSSPKMVIFTVRHYDNDKSLTAYEYFSTIWWINTNMYATFYITQRSPVQYGGAGAWSLWTLPFAYSQTQPLPPRFYHQMMEHRISVWKSRKKQSTIILFIHSICNVVQAISNRKNRIMFV